jgi:tetratricopeptide (TPR) repeat protein
MRRSLPLPALGVLLLACPSAHSQSWHLNGWSTRAIVEIPQPSTEAGVDTAGVKVLCQGRGKSDGSDYRVLDAAGRPVPFQLVFHDAARYSLLSFRIANSRERFFIYFGNPQAPRAAEQLVVNPMPGAGPPRASWIPRFGLVYATIQRPEGNNPKTVADMAKLIAASPSKHGARYQRKISDGYNPFGSSDYYISIYRGWMQIPKAGKYQFCTISNEASFSFLDGKELVHWPGRHTVERGIHGEKNTLVELSAGLHYIEYYHEEVTLEQMAFLGWRPSGDPGPFSAIPESIYTAPHAAVVTRYEDARGPVAGFEPIIFDTIWPTERHEGQYTRCRLRAGQSPALAPGTTYRWEFGDGLTATGTEVEHVYLTLGNYKVTLHAQGPLGTCTAQWPLDVYEMQHVTDEIKEGRLAEYAKLARAYDAGKLDATGLKELAHLMSESGDPAESVRLARVFLTRFGGSQPQLVPRLRRLMAACALRLGKGDLDEAVANYQASLTKDTPLAERLDVYARLIHLLGIERDLPRKAEEVLGQADEAVKAADVDEEARNAYRRVVIAAGDVYLWHAKPDEASTFYKRAEALTGRAPPPQVRAARVGAFPNSIREFLAAGDVGAAMKVVNKWEETFPTEKVHGQTFFWRGKLLTLQDQPREAARYLARSVGLCLGAAFESEARWLLAQSLEKLGRADDARKELAKLVASGINDPFTKLAREKLANSLSQRKPNGTDRR